MASAVERLLLQRQQEQEAQQQLRMKEKDIIEKQAIERTFTPRPTETELMKSFEREELGKQRKAKQEQVGRELSSIQPFLTEAGLATGTDPLTALSFLKGIPIAGAALQGQAPTLFEEAREASPKLEGILPTIPELPSREQLLTQLPFAGAGMIPTAKGPEQLFELKKQKINTSDLISGTTRAAGTLAMYTAGGTVVGKMSFLNKIKNPVARQLAAEGIKDIMASTAPRAVERGLLGEGPGEIAKAIPGEMLFDAMLNKLFLGKVELPEEALKDLIKLKPGETIDALRKQYPDLATLKTLKRITPEPKKEVFMGDLSVDTIRIKPSRTIPGKYRTIDDQLNAGEVLDRKKLDWDEFYRLAVDENAPIEKVIRDNINGGLDNPFSPYIEKRLIAGKIPGRTEKYLFHEGPLGTKALNDILENVPDKRTFDRYLLARRAIEVDKRSGGTKGIGIDLKDARRTVELLETPELKQAVKEFTDYNNALLEIWKNTGVISEIDFDNIIKTETTYGHISRLVESIIQGKDPATLSDLLKTTPEALGVRKGLGRLTGVNESTAVQSPLDMAVKDTSFRTKVAVYNEFYNNFYDFAKENDIPGITIINPQAIMKDADVDGIVRTLEKAGIEIPEKDTIKNRTVQFFAGLTKPKDPGIITFFRNGKPMYMKIDDPALLAALGPNKIESEGANILFKLMSGPSKIKRAGVGVFLPVKNVLRDTIWAGIFSKEGFIPFYDTFRGAYHLAKKDDLYKKALDSGALNASIVGLDKKYTRDTMERLFEKTAKSRAHRVMSHPIEGMRKWTEMTDDWTRLGQFDRALKKYGADMAGMRKAAFETRDLMDFMRAGVVTKEANKYTAFLNANVQGLDKAIREIRRNPLNTSINTAKYIVLPSIVLHYMNKHNPAYKKLPSYVKDLYWVVGNEDPLLIPKPFEMGVTFGTGMERALDYMETNDPKAFKDFGKTVMNVMFPELFPDWIQVAYEGMTGVTTFPEPRQVVPRSQEFMPPEAQVGAFTTRTAQTIGETLAPLPDAFGLEAIQSPRRLESLVRGLGGAGGIRTVREIEALTGVKTPLDYDANPLAILGKLFGVATSTSNVQQLDDFYDELDETKRAVEKDKFESKKRGIDEDEDLQERLKVLNKANRELGKLNKELNNLVSGTEEDPIYGRGRAMDLRDNILDIIEKALEGD
jgi:hypothetical protein